MAKQGKKVLLIDADAQGSLTDSLGFTEPDKLEETLATALGNIINDEDMEADYGILMLSRLVDTFFSRTSWTMLLYAENHSISVA